MASKQQRSHTRLEVNSRMLEFERDATMPTREREVDEGVER
jgi:hypothetical protein